MQRRCRPGSPKWLAVSGLYRLGRRRSWLAGGLEFTSAMSTAARTMTLALILLLAPAIATLAAQELEFTTENDLFTDETSRDDLYTFAFALATERHGTRFALREDAFTDRAAGVRFDETSWSFGRPLPVWRSWQSHAEAGAVRLGRGLFGEDVQNTVHRALGSDEVALTYLEPSVHGRLAFATERSWSPGGSFAVGPRVELEWVSDVRAHAIVAAAAAWRPHPLLTVDLLAGGRWSDADLALLAPHIEPFGAVVELGVTVYERIRLAWSYNDHGDGRTHLALGYRFARWRGAGEASVRN